ncbi:hypothetical protein GCM10027258_45290 [Amycolatopsis stemonae]
MNSVSTLTPGSVQRWGNRTPVSLRRDPAPATTSNAIGPVSTFHWSEHKAVIGTERGATVGAWLP